MVPKPTNHNAPNIPQIPAAIGPEMPLANAAQQAGGSSNTAQSLQDAPQLACDHYTRLMRLLNMPNLSLIKKECLDALSHIKNQEVLKQAWYAVLSCSKLSTEDRVELLKSLKDQDIQLYLASMLAENILEPSQYHLDVLTALWKSDELSHLASDSSVRIMDVAFHKFVMHSDADDGFLLLAAVTILDICMKAEALHSLVNRPDLGVGIRPMVEELYQNTLQAIVSNLSIAVKDKYAAAQKISDPLKKQEALGTILKNHEVTTLADLLMQLEACEAIADKNVCAGLRKDTLQLFFDKLPIFLSEDESCDFVYKVLIKHPSVMNDPDAKKIILLGCAQHIHCMYGQPKAAEEDVNAAIAFAQELYNCAAQIPFSTEENCLKTQLLSVLLSNTDCLVDITKSILILYIEDPSILQDSKNQLLEELASNKELHEDYRQEIINACIKDKELQEALFAIMRGESQGLRLRFKQTKNARF